MHNLIRRICSISKEALHLADLSRSAIRADIEQSVALFASSATIDKLNSPSSETLGDRLDIYIRSNEQAAQLAKELSADPFLLSRLKYWSATCSQIVHESRQWHEQLYRAFHVEGPVISIAELSGDPHGYHGVFKVTFLSGPPLVFRRRPNGTSRLWNDSIELLNQRTKTPLPTCHTIGDDSVGWQEFVKPVGRLFDAPRELRQWGIMIALAWTSSLNDAHRGNFILTNEGPVLIDTETLLAPQQPCEGVDAITSSITDSIESSLLASGVLPRPRRINGTWLDLSPFAAIRDSDASISRMPVINFGECWTIRMAHNHSENKSLPSIVEYIDCTGTVSARQHVTDGFSDGLFGCSAVEELLRQKRHEATKRRSVTRPTYQYRNELLRRRLQSRPKSAASIEFISQDDKLTPGHFTNEEEDFLSLWTVPIFWDTIGRPRNPADQLESRLTRQIHASLFGATGTHAGTTHEPAGIKELTTSCMSQLTERDAYLYDAASAGSGFLTYPSGFSLSSGLAGIVLTLDRFDPESARKWRELAGPWLATQCTRVTDSLEPLPKSRFVPGGPLHGLLFLARSTLEPEFVANLALRMHRDCIGSSDAETNAMRYCLLGTHTAASVDVRTLTADGLHPAVGYWLLESMITDLGCDSHETVALSEYLLEAEAGRCSAPLTHLLLRKTHQQEREPHQSRSTGLDGLAGSVWHHSSEAPRLSRTSTGHTS